MLRKSMYDEDRYSQEPNKMLGVASHRREPSNLRHIAKDLRYRGLRAISTAHRVNKSIASEIGKEILTAKAEADEFIQSPHLLFRPLRMVVVLAFPLSVPLFFMPFRILVTYVLFCTGWYLVCLCYFGTEVAMRPPWYKRGLSMVNLPPYWKGYVHDPKIDCGLDFESVEFPGLYADILRGWAIEGKNGEGNDWIVCVHGAGRDRRAFLRHAEVFVREGYSVLLFDTSEHGLSDCSSREFHRGTSFGAREQYDVIAAVEFVKTRYAPRTIALVGTSAGASSAILAASIEHSLVDAVAAENPFMRPDLLFQFHLSNLLENYLSENTHRTGRRLLFWFASRVLMIRIGQYFKSYGAVDAASSLKCPLLVAHSTMDDIVPFSHGQAIYEAASKAKKGQDGMVQMYQVNNCAHCALFDKDPEEWSSVVLDFLSRSLSRKNMNMER